MDRWCIASNISINGIDSIQTIELNEYLRVYSEFTQVYSKDQAEIARIKQTVKDILSKEFGWWLV